MSKSKKKFKYSSKKNKEKSFNYTATDNQYDFDYPIFCFKHIVKGYNIDKINDIHKKDLLTRLSKLSLLGFKEINKSGRHQYGNEKIDKNSLKITFPSFITEDVKFLYAYRYNGNKNPFLVYRRPNSAILHIIAIDYNFSVYNH